MLKRPIFTLSTKSSFITSWEALQKASPLPVHLPPPHSAKPPRGKYSGRPGTFLNRGQQLHFFTSQANFISPLLLLLRKEIIAAVGSCPVKPATAFFFFFPGTSAIVNPQVQYRSQTHWRQLRFYNTYERVGPNTVAQLHNKTPRFLSFPAAPMIQFKRLATAAREALEHGSGVAGIP